MKAGGLASTEGRGPLGETEKTKIGKEEGVGAEGGGPKSDLLFHTD